MNNGKLTSNPGSLFLTATEHAAPGSRFFSAQLHYWRTRRGMSQLDLALTAEVSARHISFLETGRSRPSAEMVLRLASTLDIPLRERNVMLREAGFEAAFEEPGLDALEPEVDYALGVMLRRHNPFPMMVMDRGYHVIRQNEAARRLTERVPACQNQAWNAVRVLFDEGGIRPFVIDWESLAYRVVCRLHREALRAPHDQRLTSLLNTILESPGIPAEWRKPDLAHGMEGTLLLRLRNGEKTLSFVTTMMSFQAPHNVTLEEIQIESYLPADESTARCCEEMMEAAREEV